MATINLSGIDNSKVFRFSALLDVPLRSRVRLRS